MRRFLIPFLIFPFPFFRLRADPVIEHWVAYSPSDSWQPGRNAESTLVWNDLLSLRSYHFTGIATYGTLDSLHRVARFAKRLGFQEVIVGIWIDRDTSRNRKEIEWGISTRDFADAYCVGNEALFFRRLDSTINDTNYLRWAMETVRNATNKPVTTAEPWTMYYRPGYGDWLLRNCDFLFPIINPTNDNILEPTLGALWVKGQFESLRVRAREIPVRVRESGWPTNSESLHHRVWANEEFQAEFFRNLDRLFADSLHSSFFFEAFDQFWKNWGATEPYWGLFNSQRMPKLYAGGLGIKFREIEKKDRRDFNNQPPFFDPLGRKIDGRKASASGIHIFFGKDGKRVFLQVK